MQVPDKRCRYLQVRRVSGQVRIVHAVWGSIYRNEEMVRRSSSPGNVVQPLVYHGRSLFDHWWSLVTPLFSRYISRR